MCGFAGRLHRQPMPAEPMQAVARRMNSCLRHRGPDMEGYWTDPQRLLTLAFSRLAIQDLSPAANQPMHSESGRFTIVYNGEIYNAGELCRRIHRDAASFRTHSDTEVLLACFESLGLEPTLQAANGMFAFALWDATTRSLFLVRDRLGKKPLHYSLADDCLTFASEIKALLRADTRPHTVSREATEAYFQLTYIPAPLTIFEDVRKVRPGHILEVKADLSTREWPYWSVEAVLRAQSRRRQSHRDALEQAAALLEDAVRCRLVSDVPVGVLLSGGVDSSLVAFMLSKRLNISLQTFTIGLEDEVLDEAEAARAIARRLGVQHRVLTLSRQDALELVDSAMSVLDEPFGDPSSVPMYAVCRLARSGATVLLTGDGGDEVFGGYTRYLWGTGWRGAVAHLYARYRRMRPALSNSQVALEVYRRLMTVGSEGGSASPGFLKRWAAGFGRLPKLTVLEYLRYLDFQLYLPDDILVKTDRMSMANSVELRSPFLDYRLVEFSWRLANDALVSGSVRKPITRELFVRHIGPEHLQAAKHGFALPIGQWLAGPLRPQLEEAVDWVAELPGLPLDAAELRRMLSGLRAQDMMTAYRLWVVYAYWRWARTWRTVAPQETRA
ncbi:MAG TPA: asparagine synthase (glutamine-hydrolyzing) [Terriglobales bacterium]|nr:asparagine synthase (glutamine-hydrolyzing) [Terriglobales bacterium]